MTSVTRLDGDVPRYIYNAAECRVETASSTLTTAYSYDSVGNLLTQATSGAIEIAFSYACDAAGNMTSKVLTGTDGAETALKMSYNKANQFTTMANGKAKITYKSQHRAAHWSGIYLW